ncbi:hypothetical protein CRX72_18710 [Pantoea sp. BRM17]|nr:hypothetical protein CRX72_18710 [Pantoea sp. BRM17]
MQQQLFEFWIFSLKIDHIFVNVLITTRKGTGCYKQKCPDLSRGISINSVIRSVGYIRAQAAAAQKANEKA